MRPHALRPTRVSPLTVRRSPSPLRRRDSGRRVASQKGPMGDDFAVERTTMASKLGRLRWASMVLGIGNLCVILLGGHLLVSVVSSCSGREKLPFVGVSLVAVVRLMAMVGAGIAQQATAETIVSHSTNSSVSVDSAIRHERRMRYMRWLWWTRFGLVVTMLQFMGALYLLFIILNAFYYGGESKECFLGQDPSGGVWEKNLLVSFVVLVWLVVIIQCFTGSDVLRWRSFYATHDIAWKTHYREVFDHGIREALRCLGRVKYLSVLEEDEVYSVARLLGDLVAYRASGTGHLELLAGLALLQSHKYSPNSNVVLMEAPEVRIREAAFFHQFAEAAYTGPLLDFGRNPILFPCAWLYRQGVLTPWTCNRRPLLEGDNWWRGHAAAFLKYANLSPHALRWGRVSQTKREVAYFVVVLHDKKTIVIAVRGTETPEDLITDGLCRESALSLEDLDGLINSDHLPLSERQRVLNSFPHYGHSGIIESSRELYMQIDGQPKDKDGSSSETSRFLSSLLGVGCECYGYEIRIVGHSLGGAVATLLGLRMYKSYPNLHVYAYGTLPCVDLVIAEACSDFVTTIVYNDEFSARLSVNSILRLRAAEITAMSDDSSAESAMIHKLARRILSANKYQDNGENHDVSMSFQSSIVAVKDSKHINRRHLKHTVKESGHSEEDQYHEVACLFDNSDSQILKDGFCEYSNFEVMTNGFNESRNLKEPFFERSDDPISFGDQASRCIEDLTSSTQVLVGDPQEMFLPGLVIHVVPEKRNILPLWKTWKVYNREHYKAFVADRESFKDIIVTPYMFIDHLPWRCHYALQRALETPDLQGQLNAGLNEDLIV